MSIADHAQQLLQVRQPEVLHQHAVDLGGAFVLHRDAVVTAAIEGTQDALARVHGEFLGMVSRSRCTFNIAVASGASMSKAGILMPISPAHGHGAVPVLPSWKMSRMTCFLSGRMLNWSTTNLVSQIHWPR
jgi:hypothetical protein